MLVPCVLCGHEGGSLLPVVLGMEVDSVQINQQCFEERKRFVQNFQVSPELELLQLSLQKPTGPQELYMHQLSKIFTAKMPPTQTRFPWAHHSCYYWLTSQTPDQANLFAGTLPVIKTEALL